MLRRCAVPLRRQYLRYLAWVSWHRRRCPSGVMGHAQSLWAGLRPLWRPVLFRACTGPISRIESRRRPDDDGYRLSLRALLALRPRHFGPQTSADRSFTPRSTCENMARRRAHRPGADDPVDFLRTYSWAGAAGNSAGVQGRRQPRGEIDSMQRSQQRISFPCDHSLSAACGRSSGRETPRFRKACCTPPGSTVPPALRPKGSP